MSWRVTGGRRQCRQEGIDEGDEEVECCDRDLDQFQGGHEEESDICLNEFGEFHTLEEVTYSSDGDRTEDLGGAGGYHGSRMCSPREPNNSRGQRFYHSDQSPGRRPPDYHQPSDVSPDYSPQQVCSRNPRRVSPQRTNFRERCGYNSYREQRGEDVAECERSPPRAVSPQYREPMLPRDGLFMPRASSSPYGPGFRAPYDNAPMNISASAISPFDDFTTYFDFSPFSQPGRVQTSPRRNPYIFDCLERQNFSPDSLEQQDCSPDSLEQQHFSPDSLEQQHFSPDSLEQQHFSPDSLEQQECSPDSLELPNFSPDSLEPRNTSGSPGARISPDHLEVPQNSPAVKQCYPHRSSLRTPRTPRTPQSNEDDMECEAGGGTFRKPGPEFLNMSSGSSGFKVTPSSAASSAPSFGKFGFTTPSHKDRGAPPPISCVGGTPTDSSREREGLDYLAQRTVSKPGQPNIGGTPKDRNREALEHLAQLTVTKSGRTPGGTPKEEAMDERPPSTVTKSVPPPCRRALDFKDIVDLSPCENQPGPSKRRLPKKPQLSQDELKGLIDSEAEDVEFAWLLSSDQKQTYKKPCPKQQKAQMTVKNIVEAAQKTKGDPCAKEYPPLLEPDPEDLTPELAAAMMFSHEQGVKLDSCPDQTISHLFPSEKPPEQKKPPPSKISIVDPNQKDKEELIEKSASVPSEGVSDSAYSRMKQKGGDESPSQKSYDLDFALDQEKREVVLVPQRPKRFNTIQFRGNLIPWFPGYFSAFPDQDSIKIVPSPSKLFLKAWVMTNPANLQASDIIVTE